MQQCGDDDSGNDFDYYSLEVKNGASTKYDCSNGEVCCVPKITRSPDEENECEGITGHTCMTEEVRNYRVTQINIVFHKWVFILFS